MMLGFKKEDIKKDTSKDEMIFRLMAIIEAQFNKQDERINSLLKYIKPDTVVKLQGMEQLKLEFQKMIKMEQKRIQEKYTTDKEITELNKLGT